MKIAVLCGRFGPGTGTGGVAHRLVAQWRGAGHEVLVVARHVDGECPGVSVVRMRSRWRAAGQVPTGFVSLALDRVPHCDVARASGGVHAAWLAARGGFRRWSDRSEARLDRATAVTARIVVCGAYAVAADVVAYHGVPPDRLRLVHTGVDPVVSGLRRKVREAWGVAEGGRVALFVGHGFERKGLSTALAAFRLASGPQDRLVVCGSDRRFAAHGRAAQRALGGQVLLLGPVSDVWACLSGADAMLLPTRYDAASNAVIEAMAAGVPPVTSLADGSSERVPDRALVVGDPAHVQGFAMALRYAWEQPGLGDRCRAALAGWSEARMADRLLAILGEIHA